MVVKIVNPPSVATMIFLMATKLTEQEVREVKGTREKIVKGQETVKK